MDSYSLMNTVVGEFNAAARNEQHLVDYNDLIYAFESKTPNDESFLVVSLSNNKIKVYDREMSKNVCTLTGHSARINEMVFSSLNSSLLYSCGNDGVIFGYDTRAARIQQRITLGSSQLVPLNCIDLGCNGLLLAAGTDNADKSKVAFWDIRSGRMLGEYKDSHREPITQVKFIPLSDGNKGSSILTGSLDGLACCYDTSIPGEEEALLSVLNIESSLNRMGFFGPNNECLYCLTYSETFSLWHIDKCERMVEYYNIRNMLQAVNQVADYLIDCNYIQNRSSTRQQLILASGDNNGVVYLSEVTLDGFKPIATLSSAKGHTATVRSVNFLNIDEASGVPQRIITTGEDCFICDWRLNAGNSGKYNLFRGSSKPSKTRDSMKSGRSSMSPY